MTRINVIFILFLVLLFFGTSVDADVYLKNGTYLKEEVSPDFLIGEIMADSNLSEPVLFYNQYCGACHTAREYIAAVLAQKSEIRTEQYDLFNNTTNRALFEAVKAEFNRNTLSYPVVIIGPVMLEGNEAISTYYEPLAEAASKRGPSLSSILSFLNRPASAPDEISIPLIIGAGLLDGINPCAFAVLVILMAYLISLKNRRRVILAGVTYSAAVFVFYYLSGIGIFTVVQTTGLVTTFSLVAGIIALIAGLIMIKDALFTEGAPMLAIPESRKATIQKYIEKTSLPAAALLGVLVGMFELPCTGGIYLSIISMISLKTNLAAGLWYLLIYNIAFIIPLFVIMGIVYYGIPPEKVEEWRLEKRRTLRLIIGIIMLIFAAYILAEVFGFGY